MCAYASWATSVCKTWHQCRQTCNIEGRRQLRSMTRGNLAIFQDVDYKAAFNYSSQLHVNLVENLVLSRQRCGSRRNIATPFGTEKTRMVWLPEVNKKFEDTITRFDTIHERDRQQDK